MTVNQENSVAKIKFNSKRPELSIKEVTEQYDCTEEDIFHEAAMGKLTIYVRADGWKVGCIGSIKQVVLSALSGETNELNIDDIDALFPEIKEIKSEDDPREKIYMGYKRLSEEMENSFPTEGFQEIISIGLMTFYPNNGIYLTSYIRPLFGFQPIALISMVTDRMAPNEGIWLKLIDDFGISENSTDEFFIMPDHFITLQDALKNGQLYVMKADIDRLSGLSPDENLSALFEHKNWPKELGIAIIAWQSVQYSDQQDVRPSELIRKWLKEKYPKTPKAKKLSDEAVERITTVANWDTTPGRPKKSDT
jgi:hypothetical protein